MELEEILDILREKLKENVITKDIPITEDSDLSKDEFMNDIFDIDIFISRKPGMRRSVQLITSGNNNPEYFTISLMTILCSLFDTISDNPNIPLNRKDIYNMFDYYKEMHKND